MNSTGYENKTEKKLILIWKYGLTLEDRHIHHFNALKRFSPWENCPITSCELTYNEKESGTSDAVLFHLQRMTRHDAVEISTWSHRNRQKNQIWIFLTDESPIHTTFYPEYNGLFNWSMTYRSDSDVWVPYGRTIRKSVFSNTSSTNHPSKISDYLKKIPKKDKLVAIMGSNCVKDTSESNRWKYVQSLKNLFKKSEQSLDIFGTCLGGNRTVCPGHFRRDCPLLKDYKFYLAFENSNCREYLTEKIFWNAYSKFSVPVIMGPPKKDCNRLLPPHSFIHVTDFHSPEDLFNYLRYVDEDDEMYGRYHAWRTEWRVLNEHGYFGSEPKHFCRLCQALWRNKFKKKYYENPSDYWSKNDCLLTPY
ncbi:glycoprotein 3-alpha-L-fucosyltransferase A [Fopius arisanus]|uniref:Fucosyltransferase n=2 Tax=Fopius arisanus TaxID=64838 RepID=A0A9R1TK76_9HYME|nr:PREDICTED: glycoprotein 3-alpha-L-fucosyltransferase A-like [Fopius arisanus]